jgi:hypothetical protein
MTTLLFLALSSMNNQSPFSAIIAIAPTPLMAVNLALDVAVPAS